MVTKTASAGSAAVTRTQVRKFGLSPESFFKKASSVAVEDAARRPIDFFGNSILLQFLIFGCDVVELAPHS